MKKKGIGIAIKLMAELAVLMVLVCGVLTFVSYNKSSGIIQENIRENMQNRADENAAIFEQKLLQKASEMETLARREGISSMDWSRQEPIAAQEAERLGYERIQISDANGMTRIPGGGEPFSLADKENFKISLGGKTNITAPLFSESDNKLIMIVTTPIYNPEGTKIVGVLGGVITAEQFNQIVQEIELGKAGYAYILSETGKRIADKDIEVVKEGRVDVEAYAEQSGYEEYIKTQKAMIAGEKGINSYCYEGTDYIAAYCPIGNTGWSIALAVPEQETLKDVSALKNFMLTLAVVFVLLSVIVSMFIARTIKKPLVKIETFAGELSKGNMNYQIQEKRRDEFGQTCDALNLAQENTRNLIKNILDHSQGLSAAGKELTATTEEIMSRLETIDEAAGNVVVGCEENKDSVQTVKSFVERMQENADLLNEKAKLQSQKAGEFKNRALGVQETARGAIENSREVCSE